MRIIDSKETKALLALKNRKVDLNAVVEQVRSIVSEVKEEGDAAIFRFIEKFDKKKQTTLAVDEARRKSAEEQVAQPLKDALAVAKQNIAKFHAAQMPKEWWIEILPGVQAGQLVRAIERVGCYIPGGRYPLVSTILMTILPAAIAGVKDIIVCTPKISPEILYACNLCGVHQIFEVGGAMAIAAMAYGTESIRKVDKIVGPGNLYVTAAKKIVYGDVGIDFLAGPSEVVIIAEEEANPQYIAADMLAQAEHDVTSMALCITPSKKLAAEVTAAVEEMLKKLPTRETAKASLKANGAIVLVETIEEAFAISNSLAPEHLEIHSDDPRLLALVQNAGSVFLGRFSAEAAGDYASGPNHVLPTGGIATVQTGLSVRDFIKTPSVQRLTQEGLGSIASTIITMAEAEGLAGHAESIRVRMKC